MHPLILAVIAFFTVQSRAFAADWTPLIQTSAFEGIRLDVLTTAGGIVSVLLIIVGLGILLRTLSR